MQKLHFDVTLATATMPDPRTGAVSRLVEREAQAPPLPLPAPFVEGVGASARFTRLLGFGKRLGSVTFSGGSRVDVGMIILGDSYADDVDMGFWCWPSLLARRLGISAVNASRGGSESRATVSQYERARQSRDPRRGAHRR